MPATALPIPGAPSRKRPVRELVEEAGINVDDWAFTGLVRPATNSAGRQFLDRADDRFVTTCN